MDSEAEKKNEEKVISNFKLLLAFVAITPAPGFSQDFGDYCRSVQMDDESRLNDAFTILAKSTYKDSSRKWPTKSEELSQWDAKLRILDVSPRLERPLEEIINFTISNSWQSSILPSATVRGLLLGNLLQKQLATVNSDEFRNSGEQKWSALFEMYGRALEKFGASFVLPTGDPDRDSWLASRHQVSDHSKFFSLEMSPLKLWIAQHLGASLACRWVLGGAGDLSECHKAVSSLLEIGPIQGNSLLLDADLIRQFIEKSDFYEDVLMRANILMIKNSAEVMANVERDGTVRLLETKGKLSVYEILKSTLLAKGLAQPKAEDETLNILAIFGMRGMNLQLATHDTPGLTLIVRHLEVLLQISHFWDAVLMEAKAGYLSTLPKSVLTGCDDGKSYHFWMSAYMAHRLVKKGFAAKSAVDGVFTAQSLYQFMPGATVSRKSTSPLTIKWNSVGADRYRLDATFGILGARFGAGISSKRPVDIFSEAKAKSAHFVPLSEKDANHLVELNSIFALRRLDRFFNYITRQYSLESFPKSANP